MEEIKLGKAYQRDLVVDKRYPVIRTGEQEDKKYVRGDILDANAVQQLIDNSGGFDPQEYYDKQYIDENFLETLVSGQNIKTINSNSIVGSGDVTIPTGLSTAYEVVDVGMLYLDQTNTYYEVSATVYTLLKTVLDEGKVPVLTGILVNHTTEFALIPTAYETRSALYCYWHAYSNIGSNNRWHVAGVISSTGGRLYPEEEQKPITVDQTVLDGSQNPVSGNAVYLALANLEARVAALENNQ